MSGRRSRAPHLADAGQPGAGRPFCARGGALLLAGLLAAAPPVWAAGPAGRAPGSVAPGRAAPDSAAAAAPPPYRVLLRSLAFPGWGQLENGRPLKAAAMMAIEAGFLGAGYVQLRRSDRAFEAHVAAANRGDEAEAARQFALHEDHRTHAIGYFWWTAFSVMLSGLDAYVDAHLRDFEVRRPVVRGVPPAGGTGARLELGPAVDRRHAGVALRMVF